MVKEQLLRRVARNIRWKVFLFLALPVAALGLIACGGDSASDTSSQTIEEAETVRGLILEVNAKSLLELESLRLEDEGGTIWLFEGGGRTFPGLTPSHIREHMVAGQRVSVTFERDGDVLTVVDVGD
jgi:hypothetical protein